MSVSSSDNGASPIQPLDFASFLLSPEGIDAIRKAYTPPTSIADSTTTHNRAIIQNSIRLQAPAYVIPDHLFITTQEQQLWIDAVHQSHTRGIPAIRGRIPMSSLQGWIAPAPVVSPTSTTTDWSTNAMQAWFTQYPASQRSNPLTEAYTQSIRLDLAAQPHPPFQLAMLTDPILFQEWLDSIRKYYLNGHLQALEIILGDHALVLFNMTSTIKYPSLSIPLLPFSLHAY